MQTLFPIENNWPSGFRYDEGFITSSEEEALLETIRQIELHSFLFQGYTAKRRVASFGYDWSFEKRVLSKGKAIPEAFMWLVKKVAQHLSLTETDFVELLVTEYPVGAVINWHRDAPPFGLIAGVSLSGNCLFKLRPYDEAKRNRKSIITVPVKRRSLYVMRDTARTDWEHSTAALKEVRYSITLRTLQEGL